ncbi:hypothetical protein BOTBODRAFT_632932 [Botryobasidium botryosum FD-172 SS1]|uniref:Uncharacterized protein n=1 Tax=Botryobasidium botryosum (strain FD-172 SS1) TaxID=930990 RepID=A0A067N8D3_BOTB1|nr:hypothetical protein BOTBODRAFT_632932 [Botryobasidium botryosum FD-172 SS1]
MSSGQFVSDALPTEAQLKAAAAIEIRDEQGNKVPFGSLYEDQKTVVVFIREFQTPDNGISAKAYVTQLAEIPASTLSEAGVKIAVVGCGDYSLITDYKKTTGFKGQIYADASREVYTALEMTLRNLKGTPAGSLPRSYIPESALKSAIASTWDALKQPMNAITGKNGDIKQLGGDFVFGPGNQCAYAHRMENTQDHVEVADLVGHAGIDLVPTAKLPA